MAKYPDECPVFRYLIHGTDYVLRPAIPEDGFYTRYWFISDTGYSIIAQSEFLRPLTRAARELLAWSRQ